MDLSFFLAGNAISLSEVACYLQENGLIPVMSCRDMVMIMYITELQSDLPVVTFDSSHLPLTDITKIQTNVSVVASVKLPPVLNLHIFYDPNSKFTPVKQQPVFKGHFYSVS